MMKILGQGVCLLAMMTLLLGMTVFAVQTALDLPRVYKRGSTDEVVYIQVVEDGRLVLQPPYWLETYKGPYEVCRAAPNQQAVLTKQYP